MSFLSWLRGSVSLGVVLAVVTACTTEAAEPEPREGPPPRWSLSVPTGENSTVLVGGVAVVRNDEAVFGADPGTGKELWRLPPAGLRVSGDLLVLLDQEKDRVKAFSVVDPATGRALWSRDAVSGLRVAENAIFSVSCPKDACAITRHDRRSGEPEWSVRSRDAALGEDAVGERLPVTSPVGVYLFTELRGETLGVRDTATGRPAPGRLTARGRHAVVAGRTLVSADPYPLEGDTRCTVALTAVDAESGRKKWERKVFGGHRVAGRCENRLANAASGHFSFLGSGSRIAASTEDGNPQVFDLETGQSVWRGDIEGVPIDGDDRTLLVRQHADQGNLALLDFATGRVLWTAPDPGLEGSSASWKTSVTGRFVAVSGTTGNNVHVLIYRTEDGRLLGRFPGWLQGLGEDWAAIANSSPGNVNRLQLDFFRL